MARHDRNRRRTISFRVLVSRVTATASLVAGIAGPVLSCGAPASTAPTPRMTTPFPTDEPLVIQRMVSGLGAYLGQALQENQGNLPRNPQNAVWIRAKIALLQETTLAADIINGRRWDAVTVRSVDGRSIEIGVVFPIEQMQAEALDSVRELAQALPVLEGFMGRPWPAADVRVWYGFVIGNRGGSAVVYTEDRTTYELRTPPDRLPYDAILDHELSHTFILHESLNQFLELYQYNVLRTGSTDPLIWEHTRRYVPDAPTNEGIAALLDVYRAIGHDAMRTAYRVVVDLQPPYGSPLAPNVRQVFVDAAPPGLEDRVQALMQRVTY